MPEFNLEKLAVDDIVTLRCGAVLTVREINIKDVNNDYHRIKIQFDGLNIQTADGGFSYDRDGENGQGTGEGEDNECPFDIIKVERQPMIMQAG